MTATLRGVSERNGVRVGVPRKRSVDVPSVRMRNSCYVFGPNDMSEKKTLLFNISIPRIKNGNLVLRIYVVSAYLRNLVTP